jgi:hypothetical protein
MFQTSIQYVYFAEARDDLAVLGDYARASATKSNFGASTMSPYYGLISTGSTCRSTQFSQMLAQLGKKDRGRMLHDGKVALCTHATC